LFHQGFEAIFCDLLLDFLRLPSKLQTLSFRAPEMSDRAFSIGFELDVATSLASIS
jgi:hypothetical protein